MKRRPGRSAQGFLLFLPFLIVFTLFVLVPLVQTVALSFMGGQDALENYRIAFAKPRFLSALWQTLAYTVIAALAVTALSFPCAFILRDFMRRHQRLRHLLAMPYITSMMGLSLIWLMLFNDQNGLIDKLLPLVGLQPQSWLNSPVPAFLCVLMLVVWRASSYTIFSCLLAMDQLSDTTYDAAAVAGATPWQSFCHITLPCMLPTLGYVAPTTIISVMTTFEPMVAFYYAGMEHRTAATVAYMFYDQAVSGLPGVACAMATILILPILLCSAWYGSYMLRNRNRGEPDEL